MFCQKCGAQIPDNSTFCRNCGAPVAGNAKASGGSPAIFKNLLASIKAFFSKEPENGILNAAGSKTFEWSMLLGTNVLFFMFVFAITGACMHHGFGFPLLFGFLVSIIANGLLFGALFLALTLMHKKLPFMGMLNLYAYTTLPLTIACAIGMPLAPAWHMFPMIFIAIALFIQILLMFLALQKASDNGQVRFYLFVLIFSVTIAILSVSSYWLDKASTKCNSRARLGSSDSSYDFDAYDVLDELSDYGIDIDW